MWELKFVLMIFFYGCVWYFFHQETEPSFVSIHRLLLAFVSCVVLCIYYILSSKSAGVPKCNYKRYLNETVDKGKAFQCLTFNVKAVFENRVSSKESFVFKSIKRTNVDLESRNLRNNRQFWKLCLCLYQTTNQTWHTFVLRLTGINRCLLYQVGTWPVNIKVWNNFAFF